MIITCNHPLAQCSKQAATPTSGSPGPTPIPGGPVAITASVGRNGRNLPADTVAIQDALNRVPAPDGGASSTLDADGKCGPVTIQAIQKFQLRHFGWKGADGLVEPLRQTIAKLNEMLGPSLASRGARPAQVAPTRDGGASGIPDMTESLRRTRRFILAANATLLVARSNLPAQSALRLVNKHFALDRFPAPVRTRPFNLIQNVFHRMNQLFQRPGGLWGPHTFEPDPVNDPKPLAYTNVGGFFRGGRFAFHRGGRIRLDAIYICSAFNKLRGDIDGQAFVHVHELAHFVGHPELIDDHAYNFQDDGAKMERLSPTLRVLNAESYANFAWEAAHPGSDLPRV